MSTIIRKEFREHFKVAVIGFAIFTFMLVGVYRGATGFFANLALGQGGWNYDSAQPLLGGLPNQAVLFCAIFGAILGWLQIYSERHRDLWAFLIHRPLPRSQIFFGKVIAGLGLYVLGAGLPLLGVIIMIRIPGHIAAPFEWAMVLPVTASFLSGIVYYFAGLLTGLRQARWYVSRGLGFGVAIVVSAVVESVPEFWRVLILIVVGVAIVAIAAWGSFLGNGYYVGQPAVGRRALVASLMLGGFVAVLFAAGLLASLLSGSDNFHWSRYQMTQDGAVYKMTQPAGKPLEITDLNGTPMKDPKTGRPITLTYFNKLNASAAYIYPNFKDQPLLRQRYQWPYQDSSRYFSLWRLTPDTLWYWTWNGRLLGYNIASRRFIGSLGPDGFKPGAASGPDRFSRPEGQAGHGNGYYDSSYPAKTLMTDTAVYQLDLENRTAKVFFADTNNEPVGGAVDVSLKGNDWDYTIVATKGFVQLLTPDGKLVWRTPYVPAWPAYNDVQVSFLEATNRFALWLDPNYQTNKLMGWTLPEHVVWLAAGQGKLKSTDLPSLAGYRGWTPPFGERILASVLPPAAYFIMPLIYGREVFTGYPWGNWPASLGVGVICAGIGWWLGWRYRFSAGGQLQWAVFHLFFGLPGHLAFLCVQEWPAREPCPNCKKPRRVDREHCEYCGGEFGSPPRTGTEIFEALEAAQN